jgi:hypothetical protein
MAQRPKITTGANDRPLNKTIGQSGEGLPDDSGMPVEADEAQLARIREKLGAKPPRSGQAQAIPGRANTDEVPAGTPGSGENVCRRCSGRGIVDGQACPECGGSGKVVTPIGGA